MNDEQKAILKDAVEWVEWQDTLEPGARMWDQGNWITPREEEPTCGTAYCVAGYIGQKLNPAFALHSETVIDGDLTHVSNFVEKALGIDASGVYLDKRIEGGTGGFIDQIGGYVYDLFDGDNNAKDIRAIAEELAGGPL